MSSKNSDKICTMHTSSNTEILIRNKTDEVIKLVFESLLQRYQEGKNERK